MIDTILALVPDYGLILIFAVVFLACLAAPLPASMLVLTAGSFAAAGDLSLLGVLLTTFLAFLFGDQLAYGIARVAGKRLVAALGRSERIGPVVQRSKELLRNRGTSAVFLSHTIFSPTCPYVTYLSGAGGLPWRSFALAAIPGALVWTSAYVALGYVFATQLEMIAQLITNFLGVVLAGAIAVGALLLLRNRWTKTARRDAPLENV